MPHPSQHAYMRPSFHSAVTGLPVSTEGEVTGLWYASPITPALNVDCLFSLPSPYSCPHDCGNQLHYNPFLRLNLLILNVFLKVSFNLQPVLCVG